MQAHHLSVFDLFGGGMHSNCGSIVVLCRAASVEWFAEEARRVTGDVLETVGRDRRMLTIKQPVRACL